MKKSIVILFLFIFASFLSADDYDGEWYKTQVGTGLGNCGPACVSMSIKWATHYDISVEEVREFIGYTRPDGGTDFNELSSALRYWKVAYDVEMVGTLTGLKDLIKREDLIAIVLIQTDGITFDPDDIFGKNYDLEVGHYIILSDIISSYFVVKDPLPGGSDRRYNADEVWRSLKDRRIILIRNYYD